MNAHGNETGLSNGRALLLYLYLVLLYLVLLLLFSTPFYLFAGWTRSAPSRWTPLHSWAFMWSPGLAALITHRVTTRSLRGLGWKPGPGRVLLAAYLLPLAYSVLVYAPVWTAFPGTLRLDRLTGALARFGWGHLAPGPAFLVLVLVLAPVGVAVSVLSALGEEIGWRGFLVPRLYRKYGFAVAALGSGLIWALWHYPLMLLLLPGQFPHLPPPLWSLPVFTLMVLGLSILLAGWRLRYGSLWPAVVLHASHNIYIQAVFDPLTRYTVGVRYLTGEYGLGTAVVALILGAWAWRKWALSQDRSTNGP